ncbi:uncharacterized protein LOC130367663 [Hyla sarda]|uniref:uncharacterized protein LOC130367663 n=1 Tax=Hyla sarda TaxID=327740 RepID=UPI0024C2ACE0|nr:uncharacterized protein LOC130367663 [Hyla sarda]
MSPRVTAEDPENPTSSLPRCRSLDYCLVISLVLLTMLIGSLCTVYVAWERPSHESIASAQIQNYEGEKMARNAQLVVDSVELKNGTLEWSRNGVTSTFVGSGFKHDKQELVVQKSGYYFIYSQISLQCVKKDQCEQEGVVSLTVLKKEPIKEPILNLNVQINNFTMKTQPSSFNGIARYLSAGDRIGAKLWTSHKMEYWQFDPERSVLGLHWNSIPYFTENLHEQ